MLKKEVRIGRFTFGITLILFGISILIQLIFKMDVLRYILMLWPVIFIILGIETIMLTCKKDIRIKYDIAGIFFTGIILFCGIIMSFASLVVNNILYNDIVKSSLMEEVLDEGYREKVLGKIEILNMNSKNIVVDVQDSKDIKYSLLEINVEYDKEKLNNLFLLAYDRYNIYNYLDVSEEDGVTRYTIYELPKCISEVKIKVITPNKENISVIGDNITLK